MADKQPIGEWDELHQVIISDAIALARMVDNVAVDERGALGEEWGPVVQCARALLRKAGVDNG